MFVAFKQLPLGNLCAGSLIFLIYIRDDHLAEKLMAKTNNKWYQWYLRRQLLYGFVGYLYCTYTCLDRDLRHRDYCYRDKC